MVLPSRGCVLVTPMMRDDEPPAVKTSDVRSDRNASPNSSDTSDDSIGGCAPGPTGTRPSKGTLSRRPTSSGVLTVSSRYSTMNNNPTANSSPINTAVLQSRRAFGVNGVLGTGARSINRTLLARLFATTCSSACCWSRLS